MDEALAEFKRVTEELLTTGPALMRDAAAATLDRLFTTSRHVVLGGGAMYGIMYIGVLMALCQHDPDKYARWFADVKSVAGTSAGALIGVMLVGGLDPWAQRKCVLECGLSRIMHGMLDVPTNEILAQRGISSGRAMDAITQAVVKYVTGAPLTTFAELAAMTARKFVVVVSNGATNRTEYWSADTKPDMPVWVALRCTSSVPCLFAAPRVDGCPIYDGGLMCNVPCHLFDRRSTLTMLIHGRPCRDPQDLGALLSQMLTLYTCAAQMGSMRTAPILALRSVPYAPSIDIGPLGPYSFGADPDVIDDLVAEGCGSVLGVMLRDVCIAVLLFVAVVNFVHFSQTPPRR